MRVRHLVRVTIAAAIALSTIGIGTARVDAQTSCSDSQPNVVWDGGAGTDKWWDGANWAPDGEPGQKGQPIDDFVCIPSTINGVPVNVELPGGAESHLRGIDSEGVLRVTEGGKLFLHGPEQSTAITLQVAGGTLGGEGTITVSGLLEWTSLPQAAATMTTRVVEQLPPHASPSDPVAVGRTVIAETATLAINGALGHPYDPDAPDGDFGCGRFLCGGVNLRDGRIIENRGTTTLTNAAFIAADWGTRFRNQGLFQVANDRGYYQGFLETADTRSIFENLGTIEKLSTRSDDGPSTISAFDADYIEGDDAQVIVRAGTVSFLTDIGDERSALVAGGAALQTGACADAANVPCQVPVPTSEDKQIASVAVPRSADLSQVRIVESTASDVPPRFTPIGERTLVETNAASSVRNPTRVLLVVHRAGAGLPKGIRAFIGGRTIPLCRRRPLGPSNTTCVQKRARTPQGHIRLVILTTDEQLAVALGKLRFR